MGAGVAPSRRVAPRTTGRATNGAITWGPVALSSNASEHPRGILMHGMPWKHAARALLASALLAGTAVAQAATLQILSVNDTHSNLEASGPKDANLDGTIGGLPKAAT